MILILMEFFPKEDSFRVIKCSIERILFFYFIDLSQKSFHNYTFQIDKFKITNVKKKDYIFNCINPFAAYHCRQWKS